MQSNKERIRRHRSMIKERRAWSSFEKSSDVRLTPKIDEERGDRVQGLIKGGLDID